MSNFSELALCIEMDRAKKSSAIFRRALAMRIQRTTSVLLRGLLGLQQGRTG